MLTRLSKVTVAGAMALMLAGFTTTAQGFFGPNSSSTAGERQIKLRGKVVCTGCRLQEVRQNAAYKNNSHLYQLILSGRQLVVIDMEAVSNSRWLNNLVVPHLWVRGVEAQLQKLSASETAEKEVEISAVATDASMLNVTEVVVLSGDESNKLAQR